MTASTGAPALTMIIALRGRFSAPTNSSIVRVGTNILPLRFPGGEFVGHFSGPIENGDGEALRFHVEDEVFAHDRETDQSDITLIRAHFEYLLGHAGIGGGPLYPVLIAHGNFRLRSFDYPIAARVAGARERSGVGCDRRFLGSRARARRWKGNYRDRIRSASPNGGTSNAKPRRSRHRKIWVDQSRHPSSDRLCAGGGSVDCCPRGERPPRGRFQREPMDHG